MPYPTYTGTGREEVCLYDGQNKSIREWLKKNLVTEDTHRRHVCSLDHIHQASFMLDGSDHACIAAASSESSNSKTMIRRI